MIRETIQPVLLSSLTAKQTLSADQAITVEITVQSKRAVSSIQALAVLPLLPLHMIWRPPRLP